MTRSTLVAFCLSTVALLLQASAGLAQDAGNAAGGLQIAQVSGTLQAIALNRIKILAEDKKEYFAVVSDQTTLQYRGTAEPDFLMPGLLVRFSAEVNQSGQVQAPVTELEVFTFSQQRRTTPEQAREQTPGVYQVGGEVGNVKKPGGKAPAKQTKQAAAPASGAQMYRIVGQIAGVQAGKMFVQAGAVRIQLELAPKAAITVTSRDTTFCQNGDEVKVSGLRTADQEQFIQAEALEVIGAKPLGPLEGKAAKNAKSGKTPKGKAAKAGAEKETAADAAAKRPDSTKPVPKK